MKTRIITPDHRDPVAETPPERLRKTWLTREGGTHIMPAPAAQPTTEAVKEAADKENADAGES
jgi:hypothetical protein